MTTFAKKKFWGQGFFGKAVKVTHRLTREVMVLKVLNSFEPAMEKSFLQEVSIKKFGISSPPILDKFV